MSLVNAPFVAHIHNSLIHAVVAVILGVFTSAPFIYMTVVNGMANNVNITRTIKRLMTTKELNVTAKTMEKEIHTKRYIAEKY